MDYIKSFFSNNENNDNDNKGFEIPKYDPSKDKPSNLNDRKHLLDDLSNDESNQFKKKLPESSYSPYSLPLSLIVCNFKFKFIFTHEYIDQKLVGIVLKMLNIDVK